MGREVWNHLRKDRVYIGHEVYMVMERLGGITLGFFIF